ncbi:hypothetical protein KDW_60880 [Dictyobacter vulcani]|uniref:HTH gntR-type domain-containing protein n=1 Tax=Dictyobacter vulcani TaxID=2607529 RepID=A0A5J4L384_9CHLR|nr:hypothetical protein KDW_60880 [Dictyobacter vulcani]
MAKRALPIKKPDIILDQKAAAPLYRQLYERLRAQILVGQLETGARLPSTRVLASELGVSRNTTALAYEMLLLDGYIESRVGDGTRVSRLEPELLQQASKVSRKRPQQPAAEPQIARRGQLLITASHESDSYTTLDPTHANPFLSGMPDVKHFPYELWARLLARHARQSLQSVSLYQNAQGYAPLREPSPRTSASHAASSVHPNKSS